MFRNNVWGCASAAIALVTLMAAFSLPEVHAAPAIGAAVRIGTLGVNPELDVGFGKHFGIRAGWAGGVSIKHVVSSSDVSYEGSLKLSAFDVLADWYVFGGGFHLTAGLVHEGASLTVVGEPQYGGFMLNNDMYTPSQLSSLTGKVKFGHSMAPYIGIGWGNAVGRTHRVHFLVDIGAIDTGTPVASLTAQCGPAADPVTCAQIQADTAVEQRDLAHKASVIGSWYPVIDVGLSVRF